MNIEIYQAIEEASKLWLQQQSMLKNKRS
jgi:hypothetical protein